VFGKATRAIVDPKRSFALVPHSLIPTPFANARNTETKNLRQLLPAVRRTSRVGDRRKSAH
jgi:hypothetical protein